MLLPCIKLSVVIQLTNQWFLNVKNYKRVLQNKVRGRWFLIAVRLIFFYLETVAYCTDKINSQY